MRKVIVHIGFPKTATTSIQKHVFSKLRDYTYLGLIDRNSKKYHIDEDVIIDACFMTQCDFKNKYIDENCFAKFNEVNNDYILSEENIITHDILSSLDKNYGKSDLTRTLDNLVHYFKGYRIEVIISTRNQDEIIPSFYAQHYYKRFRKNNKLSSYNSFIDKIAEVEKYKDVFNYIGIIKSIREVAGVSTVHMIEFNKLKNDPVAFVTELLSLLESEQEINGISRENKRYFGKGYKSDNPYNLFDILRKIGVKPYRFLEYIKVPDLLVLPRIENSDSLRNRINYIYKRNQ